MGRRLCEVRFGHPPGPVDIERPPGGHCSVLIGHRRAGRSYAQLAARREPAELQAACFLTKIAVCGEKP
jgi:hypothetical protein